MRAVQAMHLCPTNGGGCVVNDKPRFHLPVRAGFILSSEFQSCGYVTHNSLRPTNAGHALLEREKVALGRVAYTSLWGAQMGREKTDELSSDR